MALIIVRQFSAWRTKVGRETALREAQVASAVSRGYFSADEAGSFYEALGDKNWKTDRYSDEELSTLLKLGYNTQGTPLQARDRRSDVHSALLYFVKGMPPAQKAKVAEYAAFEISQDDRGAGGGYDLDCAFEMLSEVGDPRYVGLVKPYVNDPRRGVRNRAVATVVELNTKR